MPDKAFLDTNVLVYAFGVDDPRKPIAEGLIVGGGTVSTQTLNEFVHVELRKFRRSWKEILYWLQFVKSLCPPPVAVTVTTHYHALAIAQKFGYQIYDSVMLAAAREASCTIFYSEDLRDGQKIGDLTIRNPFAQLTVSESAQGTSS